MTLLRQQGEWEELATVDPLWAILSDPAKRGGRWQIDDFLASGVREVEAVMQRSRTLGHPRRQEIALDFGCGIGRNTRALARWFRSAIGLDLSSVMIEQARVANRDLENCTFRLNDRSSLAEVEDGSVDLLYSTLVLQHMLSTALITGYIREFVRVLAPGGLAVFQLPTSIPLRFRLQPRRHLYRALRMARFSADVLQTRFGLHPIAMRAVAKPTVVEILANVGGQVLAVDESEIPGFRIASATYWVTRL